MDGVDRYSTNLSRPFLALGTTCRKTLGCAFERLLSDPRLGMTQDLVGRRGCALFEGTMRAFLDSTDRAGISWSERDGKQSIPNR